MSPGNVSVARLGFVSGKILKTQLLNVSLQFFFRICMTLIYDDSKVLFAGTSITEIVHMEIKWFNLCKNVQRVLVLVFQR